MSFLFALASLGSVTQKYVCREIGKFFPNVNKKHFIQEAGSWAKITSRMGRLTARACHPIKK
jgi:hypothetical protein